MKTGLFPLLCFVLIILLLPLAAAAQGNQGTVVAIEIEDTITAGKLAFINRQLDNAEEMGAQLFVVVLNTPGGLVDATLGITKSFMNADVPVAVLVAPSGAIAASAGAFLVISADIAAMAPGTTVGAAHPVAVTPEGTTAADDKTTQLLAEHLRSLAERQGRPVDIAERIVKENLALSTELAREEGLVDYIAADIHDLLEQLDGRIIAKKGRLITFKTKNALLVWETMNLRESLQNWLSDPQIAFLLLIIGIAGIYLGLNMPGTFVPEVAGGLMLLMGIYGIGLFDTNTAGIIMLLLGIGLIIAEIFIAGFGVLGIGGAVSLLVGAILLPHEPLMASDWYTNFKLTAIGTVVGLAIIAIVVVQSIIRSRKRWKSGSEYFEPPKTAVVVNELKPEGTVKSRGELWTARSEDGNAIPEGHEVEVIRAEGLTLWVRPKQK